MHFLKIGISFHETENGFAKCRKGDLRLLGDFGQKQCLYLLKWNVILREFKEAFDQPRFLRKNSRIRGDEHGRIDQFAIERFHHTEQVRKFRTGYDRFRGLSEHRINIAMRIH
jgi:hypothetical protein